MIQRELDYKINNTFFWTDSKSVLRYCANESTRFHTFVANRVAVIREESKMQQWKFIDTKCNPADDASRGLIVNSFLQNKRWLEGPSFLWQPQSEWPSGKSDWVIPDGDPEVKKQVNAMVVNESATVMDRLTYFSNWMKLKATVGWLLVAKDNLKNWVVERKKIKESLMEMGVDSSQQSQLVKQRMKNIKVAAMKQAKGSFRHQALSVERLQKAEKAILGYVQQQHFSDEIAALQDCKSTGNKKWVKRSSPLYKLDPFWQNGLLRVGGRLDRSALPNEMKHPEASHISRLILEDIHRCVGHLGRNSMLAKLRQKYWILCANTLIRQIVSRCVCCRRYRARAGEQMMANLPIDRLTPGEAPFNRTGADYFGPLEVKRERSRVKRYGIVFTCLTTRAIHLEVAHSLDTDSCINGLRRFIARRGPVKVIRSDNGTNFVGAKRELQEEIAKWNQVKISGALRQDNVTWTFNPPATWTFNPPAGLHFGGIWECQIRTIRKILFSLLRDQMISIDDESLQTLF
ncbi:uncharacterized protein LOC102801455, partial [Saccoglossus kowalevskii]|uniref:Uncharacterized protein LOC102801455 n=1 Tax=Saccoglossus kowalevskii TaxID=10224 RepID=A0ABM0MQY9_SACKO